MRTIPGVVATTSKGRIHLSGTVVNIERHRGCILVFVVGRETSSCLASQTLCLGQPSWVFTSTSTGSVDLFWRIGVVWGLGCGITFRGGMVRHFSAVLWRLYINAGNLWLCPYFVGRHRMLSLRMATSGELLDGSEIHCDAGCLVPALLWR